MITSAATAESLVTFFESVWPELNPDPLKLNWHHRVIASHLEAVTRGEINCLLINMPPRHSATSLCGVVWPGWARLSGKIVLSVPLIPRPDRVPLGSVSRDSFDFLILDNPLNAIDWLTATLRKAAVAQYEKLLKLEVPVVVVMPRFHRDDLSGHILDRDRPGLVHLSFPLEYDPERHCSTAWGDDPRTKEGEILWPTRWSEDHVAEMKRILGPAAVASQFQQLSIPYSSQL